MSKPCLNILLIAGGWSPEREVSLHGASIIADALKERGHKVTFFDLADSFDQLTTVAQKHDFAFINLHGAPGEDGLVQALLDRAGCPYQGSGPAGSFLALHKAAAKQVFRAAGLNTPNWLFLPALPPQPVSQWLHLPFPLFLKPNTGGSSLGTGRANNPEELIYQLNTLFAQGLEVIIEPLISGQEITCGILGEQPLPPILIVPKGDFFDYTSKYAPEGASELCPAPLPEALLLDIQKQALAAHTALGLRGYSRTDFLLTPDNQLFLLETNTLPGMTATSLVPREAAAIGLGFADLLEELIRLGQMPL